MDEKGDGLVLQHIVGFKVISFDRKKIRIERGKYDTFNQVIKRTNKLEYVNYKYIKEQINAKKIDVVIENEKYNLSVIEGVIWDDSLKVMKMQFINGKNIEIILRNSLTYSRGVYIINQVLQRLLYYGIYWLDFAPRNIIIDVNQKKIYLVDFEKGFFKRGNVYLYLACIWEEYSSFVLENDRIKFDYNYIIDVELKTLLSNKQNRNSKRVYGIIKMFRKIFREDYLYYEVFKGLLDIEQPINLGDKNFFPIVYYENILNIFGYGIYSAYICLKIRRKLKA